MSDIRPVNYLMGKDGRVLRGGPFAPSERVRAVPPLPPPPDPAVVTRLLSRADVCWRLCVVHCMCVALKL